MKKFNFKVIITQDEDGVYVASCPSIPGCHSQGDTYEKAQKNIEEVIKLCLKVAEEDKEYANTINFGETESSQFVGITNVMANFSPSL